MNVDNLFSRISLIYNLPNPLKADQAKILEILLNNSKEQYNADCLATSK